MGVVYENYLLSAQLCCEPKAALKKKNAYLKKKMTDNKRETNS